jgi:hypothetical protein
MNIEEQLGAARLSAPSSGLDRRIDGLLGRAASGPVPARTARPGFLFAICSLGAAAAVAVALALRSPRPETGRGATGYSQRIEATGAFQQLLLTPPASRRPLPRIEVTVAPP